MKNSMFYPVKGKCSKSFKIWLTYQESLTEKLKSLTGEAHLEVVSHQWVAGDFWSKQVLNNTSRKILQREIIMRSHGSMYWYARSYIPQNCYDQEPAFFERLHHEPLGHLIFNNSSIKRECFMHYPINSHCIEYYWLKKHCTERADLYWVRLSGFSVQRQNTFYLVEIMCPKISELENG